jgi:hypothetical protein
MNDFLMYTKKEYLGFFIVLIIYWYFNIRDQDILVVNLPIETMKNISIFDGNELNKKKSTNK